jgi:hypothetical protein
MATTSNMTLNTLLNVSYGTFTRGAEFQKELEKLVQRSLKEGAKKGSKAAGEEAAKSWTKAHSALFEVGLKKQAAAFKKQVEEKNRAEKELLMRNKQLAKEERNTTDAARKREIAEERERIKKQLDQERKARSRLEDMATRRAQERMKFIEDYEAKINKTRAEKMQEAGDNLQNAIQGAFNVDNLDLSSITETLGKGLAGGLGNLAGALGAAGGAGGGAFAALAGAATTLAAVIGPLAAIAGVMAMAYNQTKDLNKEILGASSAFDLGGVAAGDFKKSLQTIRLEVVDTALDMRLSREETMAAANAMAEAGITFKEFRDISRGAKDEFEGFQDVLRSSLSAAHGLGLEVSSVAEYYNKMSRDLGYNLDQIEGSFGLISEQAQLAGMRTKDFFGAINETTTGMALYNFRIGDTATLLTELVEILGEDLAKQKIGLEGTFKGMGMQEKYKQVLLGGGKFTGAVKADMKSQAREFADSLKGTAGAEGLKKSGIVGKEGAIDTKALANMSGKAFREALETSGLSDVQKRQLQTLKTLSQAEKGGMGVAAATGALSKRGELAAQMAQGSAMFGGRLLSELSGVERMMAEEVTGRSGEEYDVLARVQEQMTAQFEQMKRSTDPEIQKKIMGKTFEEAVTDGLLTAADEDVNKIANKRHFTEVERAAREQLKESRSISQTITNVIQQLLSRIALGVELMTSLLAPFDADNRVAETSKSIARQEELTKSIDALDSVISEKKFALEETTDPVERAKLKEEIEAAKTRKAGMTKSLQDEEAVQRGIARGKSAGEVREGLLREKYGSQLDALTPEKLKAAGLSSLVGSKVVGTSRQGGEVEAVDLTELSEEQVATLEKMFEDDQILIEQDKQFALDQELRDADASKQSEEEHKELVKTLQMMDTAQATQQMASYLDLTKMELESALKGDAGTLAMIRTKFEEGEGGFTEAEKLLAARTGLKIDLEDKANDFVYRGDGNRGTITPIDKADEFYGAKPGGAIDQALQGGKAVNIYIQGGDEARVYSIVKRVLLETGYSGLKSY